MLAQASPHPLYLAHPLTEKEGKHSKLQGSPSFTSDSGELGALGVQVVKTLTVLKCLYALASRVFQACLSEAGPPPGSSQE